MSIEKRLDRIDRRLDHGDELMRLNRVAFDRNTEAFQRNREAFERNREAFDRMMAAFDRWEEREDNLTNFIREMTRRTQAVTDRLVEENAEIAAKVDDTRKEMIAQREGYFALIDRIERLGGGPES